MRTFIKIFACLAISVAGATNAQDNGASPEPALPSVEAAPIAYLVDAGSGQVLFAREANRRFMPASITKTMTAFLAFEWMEEGRLFPQQTISVRPDTFRQWNQVGSTMFLPADANVSVDDLLHGITTVSANDGSIVLAEGAAGTVADWLAAMNAKAREIGMRDSHFGTPNGWMDEGGTFTTAQDLALLGRTMIARHPSKYAHFFGSQEFTYNGITQRNHDPISGVVRGADGIKSGFTNQAGYGFLGSAFRDNRRLVMVVAGSPSGRERNRAARSLIEWGFAAFDSRLVFGADSEIAAARVQEGAERTVGLRAAGPIRIAYPKGSQPDIDLSVNYQGPLRAPIAAGERVAELVVRIEGMPDSRLPLYATKAIPKANLIERVINGVLGTMS